MLKKQQIEISGDVSEIILNDSGKIINICLNRKNIRVENIEDIELSLGDKIEITGNLIVKSVTINGINTKIK